MQGQTIRKKVIENGRKRNDTRTDVDGADWKSFFPKNPNGKKIGRRVMNMECH